MSRDLRVQSGRPVGPAIHSPSFRGHCRHRHSAPPAGVLRWLVVEQELEQESVRKVLDVLRPFAASWSGTLGRGDLVIPQRELPALAARIVAAVADIARGQGEVSDPELVNALLAARRLESVQDQADLLRRSFRIYRR